MLTPERGKRWVFFLFSNQKKLQKTDRKSVLEAGNVQAAAVLTY